MTTGALELCCPCCGYSTGWRTRPGTDTVRRTLRCSNCGTRWITDLERVEVLRHARQTDALGLRDGLPVLEGPGWRVA